MNTIEFGRFRLQTGLRIEATQLDILGFKVINNVDSNGNPLPSTVISEPANTWYWDPLPSVQLRYRLTNESDIRAVYGRGISRPNPYDMVPYVTEDDSTQPLTVSIGNPNLKPEHANNYDLLYEHYLKPFGLLQAGFFYKQLSSPIYYITNPSIGPGDPYYNQYPGDMLSYIINGSNAQLWGIEASLHPAPWLPAWRAKRSRDLGQLRLDCFERRPLATSARYSGTTAPGSQYLEH